MKFESSLISGNQLWHIQVKFVDTFSKLTQISWQLATLLTKPSADKCCLLCKLITNSMHVNLGQTSDGIAAKYIIGRNECYKHRPCLKNFSEDCSCHHCQISRGLPEDWAISHKQWPLRLCMSSLKPDRAADILLIECSNALHPTTMLQF